MKVLVGMTGTSVVEMPLGKELEPAVMVIVWVCTRGGCGWEHSPMSGYLAKHFGPQSYRFFHTMHSLVRIACVDGYHRKRPSFSRHPICIMEDFWKHKNHFAASLPTTTIATNEKGENRAIRRLKDDKN